MKKNLFLAIGLTACLSLSSCFIFETKEDQVIEHMKELCEKMEQKGANAEEWEAIAKEYQELAKESEGCEFTPEQKEQFNKLNGQFTAQAVKQATGKASKTIGKFLKNSKNFIKGVNEALKKKKTEENSEKE